MEHEDGCTAELDLLELGQDPAEGWDGVWFDYAGELSARPGWWWTW